MAARAASPSTVKPQTPLARNRAVVVNVAAIPDMGVSFLDGGPTGHWPYSGEAKRGWGQIGRSKIT
jgi:hypothetical protein